jgi:hypothetical protein
MPFQDSMMRTSLFSSPNLSAHPRLDENRILKTNACRPNCLTPKKPKLSSPCTRTRNPSPRHPCLATSRCPLLGRSKRTSQRPCRLPRSRRQSQSSVGGPSTPTSPRSPPSKVPFRGRHGDQASFGTTRTRPSTRRRSLESTISMIQEALDSKDLEAMAGEGGETVGIMAGVGSRSLGKE